MRALQWLRQHCDAMEAIGVDSFWLLPFGPRVITLSPLLFGRPFCLSLLPGRGQVVEDFAFRLEQQLDLRNEAAHLERFLANFAGVPEVGRLKRLRETMVLALAFVYCFACTPFILCLNDLQALRQAFRQNLRVLRGLCLALLALAILPSPISPAVGSVRPVTRALWPSGRVPGAGDKRAAALTVPASARRVLHRRRGAHPRVARQPRQR